MRERKTRKLVMYGLIVALMATTVAYAVLQTTLNINGTVTKKGGSWNIYFTNLSTPSKANGTLKGEASVTNPSLSATSFTFEATLVKPLDSITYTFDVVNDGTIDAELDSIALTGVAEAKDKDITYTLTYADGTQVAKGDALASKETKTLKLTLSYDDVETLDSEDSVLDVGATLVYVQASDATLEEINGYKVAVDLYTDTDTPASVKLVKEVTDVAMSTNPTVVRLSNNVLADNNTNEYPMTYNEQTKKYEAIVPETGTYSIIAEADKHLSYTMTSIVVDSHKDFIITLVGGDVNGSGEVNAADLGDILKAYNTTNPQYDLTGDGIVNFWDLFVVLNNFNKTASYEGAPVVTEPATITLDVEEGVTLDTEESVYKLVVSVTDESGDFKALSTKILFDNNIIIPVDYYEGLLPDYSSDDEKDLPFKPGNNGTSYATTFYDVKWVLDGANSSFDVVASGRQRKGQNTYAVYEMYFKLAEGKTLDDITEDTFTVDFMAYMNGAGHYYGHNDESLNTLTLINNIGR